MLLVVPVCLPVLVATGPGHFSAPNKWLQAVCFRTGLSKLNLETGGWIIDISQMVAGVLCAELVCAVEEPGRCCALGRLLSCAGQHPQDSKGPRDCC